MKRILFLILLTIVLFGCKTINWKYEKGDVVYLKDDSTVAIITTKWFGPKYHMIIPSKEYEHITLPETAIYGKKMDKILDIKYESYPKSTKMIGVTLVFKDSNIVKKYDSIIIKYPDTIIFYEHK